MYTGEFSMGTRVIEGKVPQAILGGRGHLFAMAMYVSR